MSKRLQKRPVLAEAARVLADRTDLTAWRDDVGRLLGWIVQHGGKKVLKALRDEITWRLEVGP